LVIGTGSGEVAKLNAANGSLAWSVNLSGGIVQGVTIEGSGVFVGTTVGLVIGLNLSSGAIEFQTNLGAPIGGALDWDSGLLVAVTKSGSVVGLLANGTVDWRTTVGAPIVSAAAVGNRTVYVGDTSGNLTALSESSGTFDWRFSTAALHSGDAIYSTPALGLGEVVFQSNLGHLFGLWQSNGTIRWQQSVGFLGYQEVSSPALSPGNAYFVGASYDLTDVDPITGTVLWSTVLGGAPSMSSPALTPGELFVGNEVGCLYAIGSTAQAVPFPVSGTVVAANGTPLSGAVVSLVFVEVTTDNSGSFTLLLTNGTYTAFVFRIGYFPGTFSIVVAGPVNNLRFVLNPLFLYAVTGVVVNTESLLAVPNATVALSGPYGYLVQTTSDPNGSFQLTAPNGTNQLTAGGKSGFGTATQSVQVNGAAVGNLRVLLTPTTGTLHALDPDLLVVLVPVAVIGAVLLTFTYLGVRDERIRAGLGGRVFSPFSRFVAMRSLLIPAQVVAVLTLLFIFGTFLPAASQNVNPCSISGGTCQSCSWSDTLCVIQAFFGGYATFLVNMFTGNWGVATFGNVHEPAVVFLQWWLPNSLEIAIVALGLSFLFAWFAGLYVGWRRGSLVDSGARVSSLVGLLLPSFLVVLLIIGIAYVPFLNSVGDVPFGTLPSLAWFSAHGGVPPWIGEGYNTAPTGFPVVDAAYHQQWAVEVIVLAKLFLQAFVIAIIYVAIFLRYLRLAVSEAAGEPHVGAARARGVPERTLLWQHTARRVLPIYLLVFGLTLPVYLGTQALVEATFNDNNTVGTLLLAEMSQVQSTKFGFPEVIGGLPHVGNVYQVTVFLLAITVLVGALVADVLNRYLDPRLRLPEQ